jgi:hypothetical protein
MNKLKISLFLIALACLLSSSQLARAQGGGCPAEPAPAWIGDWGQQVLLIAGIPEGAPQDVARGVYRERQVEVTVDPATQRVILSSTQFEDLCVDDAFDLSVLPTGVTWRLDFRAGGGIQSSFPVDISAMFGPGEHTVTIKVIDLVRPHASASPIWISIIPRDQPLPDHVQVALWTGPGSPAAAVSPLPTATATIAPTSSPTAGPAVTITRVPAASPSPVPQVVVTPSGDDSVHAGRSVPWPFWLLVLMFTGGLAIWLAQRTRSQVLPQGELDIEIEGEALPGSSMPIDLPSFKEPVVRAGGAPECHIRVPGEDVPPLLIQFRAERNEFGQVETLLDRFDPISQEVVETFLLGSGDELTIHPITIVYTNYAEQEPIYVEGDYYYA